MRDIKSVLTKKLNRKKNLKGAQKTRGPKKTFDVKLIIDDFMVYFSQNKPYFEKEFGSFFDRMFVLWEKIEFKLEFKQREFALLKNLGLKNDFVFIQLLSDLGEFGLDVQTFMILCFDALLNQDEYFKDVLLYLIARRKGWETIKNGKEVWKQILKKRTRDLKNFEKFVYQVEEN